MGNSPKLAYQAIWGLLSRLGPFYANTFLSLYGLVFTRNPKISKAPKLTPNTQKSYETSRAPFPIFFKAILKKSFGKHFPSRSKSAINGVINHYAPFFTSNTMVTKSRDHPSISTKPCSTYGSIFSGILIKEQAWCFLKHQSPKSSGIGSVQECSIPLREYLPFISRDIGEKVPNHFSDVNSP
ncbi:hypothetical protein O181_081806 [Austropuccinia psidii MF-1]|uniref:Uncharacterized protein n=1 Tax=Austropuccinia psidii MF-1 TaxID=1389203 RepID=A0A9Q3FRE0_9BASI|nr:hypothetical protein [Austropuccinia psidii MF-1]